MKLRLRWWVNKKNHAIMQHDFFALLDGVARDDASNAHEALRLKRMLMRHPGIVDKAIALVESARARSATHVRTDWLIAELGMFHGVELGNENREPLARLILRQRPDLRGVFRLRGSERADFIMREGRP